MQPLNSPGQVFGMALALIETIKNNYPEFLSNHTIALSSEWTSKDAVNIKFNLVEEPKILKEW